jgi:hypothetical protein
VPPISPHFMELFDAAGKPRGLHMSPELWSMVKDKVFPLMEKALYTLDPSCCPEPEVKPEPRAEWDTLLAYWDFTYPPSYEVSCAHCGQETPDWSKDEPRKFRLRTANLGGLVTFQCQSCKALVLKKHFKKHLTVECKPFIERS